MTIFAPSWVYPNAYVDLDFRNKRYWGGYVDEKYTSEDKGSLISDGGAYSAGNLPFTPQRNGVLKVGGSAQNRITDLGYYQERGATNNALWSRDMTNAVWAKTNATVSLNQPSADNLATANTASSIIASAANATVLQSVTLSSSNVIYSAQVKRLSGSGEIDMTMDGGTTWNNITSQLNSSGYAWVQIPLQALANPSCGFRIVTSGDSIAVDLNMLESGSQVQATSKATTPLVTTTATVTRPNQTGYFSNGVSITTGNEGQRLVTDLFSYGGPYSMLMSWNGDVTTGTPNGPFMIATDMTSPSVWGGGAGVGFGVSGNRTSNTGNTGRLNWNKSCGRTNGKGTQFCLNGGTITGYSTGTPNTPNANSGASHFNIGQNGSGTADAPLNGSIGRVTFWKQEITDGQMIEYTNLTNPIDPYP